MNMNKIFTVNLNNIDVAMKIKKAFKKAQIEVNYINHNNNSYSVYTVTITNESVDSINKALIKHGLKKYCYREQAEPFTEELPF